VSIPTFALRLVGFVLAHAAWSISDVPKGELPVPLAIVERQGQRQLFRFEAETQDAAIAKGKATVAEATDSVDAWAFAREGLLPKVRGSENNFKDRPWGTHPWTPQADRCKPFGYNDTWAWVGISMRETLT